MAVVKELLANMTSSQCLPPHVLHRDQLVTRVSQEKWETRATQDPRDRMDSLARPERPAPRVHQETLEMMELK